MTPLAYTQKQRPAAPPACVMLRAAAAATAILSLAGCAISPPRIRQAPPPLPGRPPSLPAAQGQANSGAAAPAVSLDEFAKHPERFTLADAVRLALANNPATRAAWADARAAAARYGSARGAWLPRVDLSGTLVYDKELSTSDQPHGSLTQTEAAATLSYLLLDFGGRSGAVAEARQGLLAADWTRNAVMQNTVLQAEVAFFGLAGAKALLEAFRTSLAEAAANLAAAEERHRLGLATLADVLQARTANAEARLAVQEAEGQVRTARGALAVAMGFPANIAFDPAVEVPEVPRGEFARTVDQLIATALASRPDLMSVRSLALASEARKREALSGLLPSLSVSGSVGRQWYRDVPGYANMTFGSVGLQIPLFNGLARNYDLLRAKAEAEAARERVRVAEQSVVFQVYATHSEFLTAAAQVETTDDLVASASQSEAVALGRYREGVGSILDLLSAQKSLAQARAAQINAREGWYVKLAQLSHDVGILGLPGDSSAGTSGLLPTR
jgi:outer membrane protein